MYLGPVEIHNITWELWSQYVRQYTCAKHEYLYMYVVNVNTGFHTTEESAIDLLTLHDRRFEGLNACCAHQCDF